MSENENNTQEDNTTSSTNDVAKLVNSAVTSQLKREIKKLVPEILAGLQQHSANTTENNGLETSSASAAADDPIAKMAKEIEKLKKQNTEFIKSKQEAERNAKMLKLEATIKNEIGARVAPHIQELLIPHLMKNVNEDGEIVFGDNVYDIQTGLNEYLNGAGQKYLTVQPKKSQTTTKTQPTISRNSPLNIGKSSEANALEALSKNNLLNELF